MGRVSRMRRGPPVGRCAEHTVFCDEDRASRYRGSEPSQGQAGALGANGCPLRVCSVRDVTAVAMDSKLQYAIWPLRAPQTTAAEP